MQADAVKTISRIHRLKSSEAGNPRFGFDFTDGTSANLRSNASFGYEVGNPGFREGSRVVVHFTGRGTIANMDKA